MSNGSMRPDENLAENRRLILNISKFTPTPIVTPTVLRTPES